MARKHVERCAIHNLPIVEVDEVDKDGYRPMPYCPKCLEEFQCLGARKKGGNLMEHRHDWDKGYWARCDICDTVVEGDNELPYCKICGANGRETHTHDTTTHEEEPALWGFVAELITWTYRQRAKGNIARDHILKLLAETFDLLLESEEFEDALRDALDRREEFIQKKQGDN